MELLKDKQFNGISFDIIREEYKEGYSSPFRVILRVSNYNDYKKNISVDMKYISTKHGLKNGVCVTSGVCSSGVFIPNNTFIDMEFVFDDITCANNGDRIELDEDKIASLRLIREKKQWVVVESIERSSYNRELKNRVEQFEAIEEQCGITLQNFSIKVKGEDTMDLFFEVLALNGVLPKKNFTINIAIYDSNNDIVYTDRGSIYASEFKGFEVLSFERIKLDITVDEISKIRIYPTQ